MKRLTIAVILTFAPLLASAQTLDRINVFGAGGKSIATWHGQADVQTFNVELTHAWTKATEFGGLFSAIGVWEPRSWFGDQYGDPHQTVKGLHAGLVYRHHFRVDAKRIGYYGEAMTGPMWTNKYVPAATDSFNFMTQAGAGIELFPSSRHPFMIGYRFSHISNGGMSTRNPGFNVSNLVIGFVFKKKA